MSRWHMPVVTACADLESSPESSTLANQRSIKSYNAIRGGLWHKTDELCSNFVKRVQNRTLLPGSKPVLPPSFDQKP